MILANYRYKLIIAYEGTHYSGWQVQPNAITIQELIQNALLKILKKPTHVTASGRTDAGVHARAQVAHFDTTTPLDTFTTLRGLNGLLPHDIRILSIEPVADNFHSRFDAQGKTYHYNLSFGPAPDPFMRHFSVHLYQPCELQTLKYAASHFVGTHDFSSFANSATKGAAAKNPIRTICALDLIETAYGLRIEVSGNGFSYKMVRNIVGALIAVNLQKINADDIPKILEAKDRRQAPVAAPARGLFLHEVIYNS
ncbi:MAG: tRNA pseudouridine(38-40) synthase TruA [Chlamydiia bacterium]|nr:tRNA pseudouridine(38-40) synthase TruA [Chlamydiia bacterium]